MLVSTRLLLVSALNFLGPLELNGILDIAVMLQIVVFL